MRLCDMRRRNRARDMAITVKYSASYSNVENVQNSHLSAELYDIDMCLHRALSGSLYETAKESRKTSSISLWENINSNTCREAYNIVL